jgi:hypothetical protein
MIYLYYLKSISIFFCLILKNAVTKNIIVIYLPSKKIEIIIKTII